MKATIEAARKAQIAWASNPTTRANALLAAAKLFKAEESRLIDSMVSEVHKPLTEARGECARAIAILEYFGAAALDPDGSSLPTLDPALLLSLRKPHGVAWEDLLGESLRQGYWLPCVAAVPLANGPRRSCPCK